MLKYHPSTTDTTAITQYTASSGVPRRPAQLPVNSRWLHQTTKDVVATPSTAWMISDAIGRSPGSSSAVVAACHECRNHVNDDILAHGHSPRSQVETVVQGGERTSGEAGQLVEVVIGPGHPEVERGEGRSREAVGGHPAQEGRIGIVGPLVEPLEQVDLDLPTEPGLHPPDVLLD